MIKMIFSMVKNDYFIIIINYILKLIKLIYGMVFISIIIKSLIYLIILI